MYQLLIICSTSKVYHVIVRYSIVLICFKVLFFMWPKQQLSRTEWQKIHSYAAWRMQAA